MVHIVAPHHIFPPRNVVREACLYILVFKSRKKARTNEKEAGTIEITFKFINMFSILLKVLPSMLFFCYGLFG